MRQVITLSNSFILREIDNNNNVISELGFRKGGLSYLIKNNNIKFYLVEDYFYKNVVWSADIPLNVNGVEYDANTLPSALRSIFISEGGGGGDITVDQELNENSTNPIGNQAVARAVRENSDEILNRYTKTETDSLLDSYYTKMENRQLFQNYAKVDGDILALNNDNITI